MPEVGLSREFLHRSCVQFSPSFADDTSIEAETQHALRFVRLHAADHASEITRALVWRVVDTDDANDKDRAGAWTVLTAVLLECGDAKSDLSRTVLAEKLSLFLPYLIEYRWYSTASPVTASAVLPSGNSGGAVLSSDPSGPVLPSSTSHGPRLDTSAYGKVVPAALINGSTHYVTDVQRAQEMTKRYHAMLSSWKGVWRSDVYQRLREMVKSVERRGNHLSSTAGQYLDIPATFKDSLWRLRRRSPRPSIAMHVLCCYGWVARTQEVETNNVVRPRGLVLPATMAEVEPLDPAMHPIVKTWLRKLIEKKGGCRLCDSWQHTEARCPCEVPFQKPSLTEERDGRRRRTGAGAAAAAAALSATAQPYAPSGQFTFMEAVEKLYRYGITLPLRVDKALDRVTQLIQSEQPYEELLVAFDVVRGAVTGPLERHALWLHASYSLLPSRTVFDKPSDEALSPAMEKAEVHFKRVRRFREWDQLLQSVEVLDGPFRRRDLPSAARRNLDEIRETNSFFFCLVDGSLPATYTPGRYARVPEEVVAAAPLKDILCPVCLEPFHVVHNCPKPQRELWDLQVARLVLEDSDLLNLSLPDEQYRLQDALTRIDEDDRQAKEFRKAELELAVKLIHERHVPLCSECNVAGHSTRRCEVHARRVLEQERLREVDLRLDPRAVQRRLREYARDEKDNELRELRNAFTLIADGPKAYPASYITAIRELDDARIPLAAARYSTDAVQAFLLLIHSSDLLQHLQPLRDELFPEVCLFCDSYHHTSEDCERAREEERGFLRELRQYGLTLWQYLRKTDYYDERLPTDYHQGKESVLALVHQFIEDYAPGGIARHRFIEHNGLGNTVAASQGVPTLVASQESVLGSLFTGTSQRPAPSTATVTMSLYGSNFSQLVQPTATSQGSASVTSTGLSLSTGGLVKQPSVGGAEGNGNEHGSEDETPASSPSHYHTHSTAELTSHQLGSGVVSAHHTSAFENVEEGLLVGGESASILKRPTDYIIGGEVAETEANARRRSGGDEVGHGGDGGDGFVPPLKRAREEDDESMERESGVASEAHPAAITVAEEEVTAL